MNLKEKAIKIQGKDYVLVSDRIIYFNENYENGSIVTEIVELKEASVVIKATITPDANNPSRTFTGYSQEVNDGKNFINKTSMIENAETSAVGRALAMMGIGVIDSIASVDEIKKATNRDKAEDGKPRFNDPELEQLKASYLKGEFEPKNYEEAKTRIIKKYRLSKTMDEKIQALFSNMK